MPDHFLGGFGTLFPWFQEDNEQAVVEIVAWPEATGGALDDRADGAFLAQLLHRCRGLEHVAIHRFKAGPFGRRQVGVEDADIFRWHQFAVDGSDKKATSAQEQGNAQQRQQRFCDHPRQQRRIAILETLEPCIDPASKPPALLFAQQL